MALNDESDHDARSQDELNDEIPLVKAPRGKRGRSSAPKASAASKKQAVEGSDGAGSPEDTC